MQRRQVCQHSKKRSFEVLTMKTENFKKLDISDYESVQKCLNGQYNNSEASFSTMYMWQHYAQVKYLLEDSVLYSLCKNKDGNFSSFMPYGKNRNSIETVDKLFNMLSSLGKQVEINLCTKDFVDFISESTKYNIEIIERRDSFDYVYKTEELINLPGRRYHSKKNHINSFGKKYQYRYCTYDASMRERCMEFCDRVLSEHYMSDRVSYETELYSIKKTFDHLETMNLKCGLLILDDNIIALSVGEKLNNDYALIHIEKADYNYREAYSVINNLFLKNEFSDTKFVNREEDMGIEGLRKAKLSYRPCEMIEKYKIILSKE